MSVALQDEPRTGAPGCRARAILLALLALGLNVGCGQSYLRPKQENWLEAAVHPGNYRPDPASVILTATLRERDRDSGEFPQPSAVAMPSAPARPPVEVAPVDSRDSLLAACRSTGIAMPRRGTGASRAGDDPVARFPVVSGTPADQSAQPAGSAPLVIVLPEQTAPFRGNQVSLIEACQITRIPPPIPPLSSHGKDPAVARAGFGSAANAVGTSATSSPVDELIAPSTAGQTLEAAEKTSPATPVREKPLRLEEACEATKIPPPARPVARAKRSVSSAKTKKTPKVLAGENKSSKTAETKVAVSSPEDQSLRLKEACAATKIPPPAPRSTSPKRSLSSKKAKKTPKLLAGKSKSTEPLEKKASAPRDEADSLRLKEAAEATKIPPPALRSTEPKRSLSRTKTKKTPKLAAAKRNTVTPNS